MDLASSTSRPLYPLTHCIGGWMGPRAGVHNVEKIKFLTPSGLELRPSSRPAPSQSFYADCVIPTPTPSRMRSEWCRTSFLSAYCSLTHLQCLCGFTCSPTWFSSKFKPWCFLHKISPTSFYKYRQINGLLIPYTLPHLAHELHVRNSVSTQALLIRLLSHCDMLPQSDCKARGPNRTAPYYSMILGFNPSTQL
jgi:hypothetical protein